MLTLFTHRVEQKWVGSTLDLRQQLAARGERHGGRHEGTISALRIKDRLEGIQQLGRDVTCLRRSFCHGSLQPHKGFMLQLHHVTCGQQLDTTLLINTLKILRS